MKKIFNFILLIGSLALWGCDNFDEDEYKTFQSSELTESTEITAFQNHQVVLLEDYTGWGCVNCPAAAAKINELQAKYGNKLIAMGVHAGTFAKPGKSNNFQDFRTIYGEKWNTLFGITSYPSGLINRLSFGSSKIVGKDDWDSKINETLNYTDYKMNINLGAEKKDSYILVSAQYQILKDINNSLSANVLVIEDGIKGVQLNSDAAYGNVPKITDYVFNHVLRTNGQIDLSLGENFSANDALTKNYKINIDSSWNLAKCKVVVFVANTENGEVVQCNEVTIK